MSGKRTSRRKAKGTHSPSATRPTRLPSVVSTGGAGFNFEDRIAAYFLAVMLTGTASSEFQSKPIVKLDWQARESGWNGGLDDLMITLGREDPSRLAVSIKRGREVNASGGFEPTFVKAALGHWRSDARDNPFRKHRDLMGLAVGTLAGQVASAWAMLANQLRHGDTARLAQRLEHGSNATVRALFRSLRGPELIGAVEALELCRHIILLDFTPEGPRSEGNAVRVCQDAIVSGKPEHARALWQRLLLIAGERRAVGGAITYAELVSALREEFPLKAHPDHGAAWRALHNSMTSRVDEVCSTVCGEHLPREVLMQEALAIVDSRRGLALFGEAGSGKSALAKALLSRCRIERCIWLDSETLDVASMAELDRRVGVDTPLTTLLPSTTERACLVVDAMELLTPQGTKRLISLLSSLGPDPNEVGWTVVFTGRPQCIASVRAIASHAGIAGDYLAEHDVPRASDTECSLLLQKLSPPLLVLLTREIGAELHNLKVLDWLLTDAAGLPAQETDSWRGLTGLIDSLWNRWIGDDSDRLARAGVLKKLAVLEGADLSRGIGLSKLDSGELRIINEHRFRDLVINRRERLYFQHDLVGDWARLQRLIEEDNPRAIEEFANLPRWHDSIRLFSQKCLEEAPALAGRWLHYISALAGDTPSRAVAQDLFLEGLFFSSSARALVENAWPVLIRDNGLLLRRMLGRFLIVCTVPDPAFVLPLSPAQDIDIASLPRTPASSLLPLWSPLLAALADHIDEVASSAPFLAGKLCGLWLRHTPQGADSRELAARIALACATELHALDREGFFYSRDRAATDVFDALLHAARELPDEVSDLCLQLARRRGDSPEIDARVTKTKALRAAEFARRQRSDTGRRRAPGLAGLSFERGPLREQYVDGPAESVNQDFQRSVHESTGVVALAAARPAVASEVVLACSLVEPRHESPIAHELLTDHFGVESLYAQYFPPMFLRGPWLALIRQNPSAGLDALVRLTNQATDNWKRAFERHSPREVSVPSVELECGSYFGDARVFAWNHDGHCSAHLLTSALMALEWWLYEQLGAKQSVDAALQRLLNGSRSTCVLGVLVTVGKRDPSLFLGPLRPLCAEWRLSSWDAVLTLTRSSSFAILDSTSPLRGVFGQLATAWQSMPHRALCLSDVLVRLSLSDSAFSRYMSAAAATWLSQSYSLSGKAALDLQSLAARFDPSNYTRLKRNDDSEEWQFEWPEHLRTENDSALRLASRDQLVLQFPLECAQVLERAIPLDSTQAAGVWNRLRDLEAVQTDDPQFRHEYLPNAIMGGIALLLVLAPDWLALHADYESWCRTYINKLHRRPPPRSTIDTEHSAGTYRWHSFLAHIAIADLARQPNCHAVRLRAAESVMCHWHATGSLAMRCALQRRGELGAEFERLANLCALWAGLRCMMHLPLDPTELEQALWVTRRAKLKSAYASGRLSHHGLDWRRIGAMFGRSRDRHLQRRRAAHSLHRVSSADSSEPGRRLTRKPDHPGFDIESLRHLFAWLQPPSDSDASDWRQKKISWASSLLQVSLPATPRCGASDADVKDVETYPFDRWILSLVAQFISRMRHEEPSQELWGPILKAAPFSHRHALIFLDAWSSAFKRLTEDAVPAYLANWRTMICFARNDQAWAPDQRTRWSRRRELWTALMGIKHPSAGAPHNEDTEWLAPMLADYDWWASEFLSDGQALALFACFLQQSMTRSLLLPSLQWFVVGLSKMYAGDWSRAELASELSRLLTHIWREQSDALLMDPALSERFSTLLGILVQQQCPIAIALREFVAKAKRSG